MFLQCAFASCCCLYQTIHLSFQISSKIWPKIAPALRAPCLNKQRCQLRRMRYPSTAWHGVVSELYIIQTTSKIQGSGDGSRESERVTLLSDREHIDSSILALQVLKSTKSHTHARTRARAHTHTHKIKLEGHRFDRLGPLVLRPSGKSWHCVWLSGSIWGLCSCTWDHKLLVL